MNKKSLTKARICAALSVSLGAILAGCSGSTNYADVQLESGIAQLQPETQTMTLPLDEYDFTLEDNRLVSYASDLLIRDCVRAGGGDVDVVDRRELGKRDSGPSAFGVWDITTAARYGYSEPPPSETMARLLAMNAGLPADVQPLWTTCLNSVDFDEFGLDQSFLDGDGNLALRGAGEAWTQASGSQQWRTAVDAWAECLQEAGLERDPDSALGVLGAANMPQEQQIAAAVADVQCKEETDVVQTLGDLLASYQLTFIRQNEAALIEQQARVQELEDAANDVIRRYA